MPWPWHGRLFCLAVFRRHCTVPSLCSQLGRRTQGERSREIEESRFQGSGFSGPRDVRERGEEHEHSSQTLVLARGVQAMWNPLR